MTSWNGLYKLPIVIFCKKNQTVLNWSIKNGHVMEHKIKAFEHIWQPGKELVTWSWPFFFPITNFIKNEVKFLQNVWSFSFQISYFWKKFLDSWNFGFFKIFTLCSSLLFSKSRFWLCFPNSLTSFYEKQTW